MGMFDTAAWQVAPRLKVEGGFIANSKLGRIGSRHVRHVKMGIPILRVL